KSFITPHRTNPYLFWFQAKGKTAIQNGAQNASRDRIFDKGIDRLVIHAIIKFHSAYDGGRLAF
ncbi:MAG: hypothetical protein R6V54_11110, partial [Desulfobacteraceae bacterium]